jgi:DNA (cytosine-5)-methyltransferase 1
VALAARDDALVGGRVIKGDTVDFFAGGGGASLGIEWALGRSVDVAINHNKAAIAMHKANHPKTLHFPESVWKVKPQSIIRGRPQGLWWFSPDCTHYSRARGAKPVKKSIRGLAGAVPRFAHRGKPLVIMLENVAEFETWGPCLPMWKCADCNWTGTEGQATLAQERKHRRACGRCQSSAIHVALDPKGRPLEIPDPKRAGQSFRRWWRRMEALGYKGEKRVLDAADYGAPTHRKRLFVVFRRDGEPIRWPEPTHADPSKIQDGVLFGSSKPYRTTAECIDWDIPCPSIFLTPEEVEQLGLDCQRPLADATMGRIAYGIKRYVLETATPFIVPLTHTGKRRPRGLEEPFPVITGAHRGELMLISPSLVQMGYGERKGQKPRILNLHAPMGVIVGGGGKQALVAAFLEKFYGGKTSPGASLKKPIGAITETGHTALLAANLIRFNHDDAGLPIRKPMPTVTGSNHAALVYSFLVKYFGTGVATPVGHPMPTATDKARFGLVVVHVEGEPYVIVDIGMRMLTPRELARGQGFPDSYVLTGSKTNQIARIGNSVCPQVAEALVRANCL